MCEKNTFCHIFIGLERQDKRSQRNCKGIDRAVTFQNEEADGSIYFCSSDDVQWIVCVRVCAGSGSQGTPSPLGIGSRWKCSMDCRLSRCGSLSLLGAAI